MRLPALLFALCALLPAAAPAADHEALIAALNKLRGHAAVCRGKDMAGASPLAASPALARAAATLAAHGGDLNAALAQAGYFAPKSYVLHLSGVSDTGMVAQAVDQNFCGLLRSPEASEIGIAQQGADITMVLARPRALPAADSRAQAATDHRILELINEARAHPRLCGAKRYGAAAPLAWDARLAAISRAYAAEMADGRFLSHTGRDGSQPQTRADRAGYAWSRLGENIAAGQPTPEQAVGAWLRSPGHCANLMDQAFSVTGAGYAVNRDDGMGVYWTQMFAVPR
jgi:uncharacterized protein YkwD